MMNQIAGLKALEMKHISVAAVVVSYNRKDVVRNAVAALLRQTVPLSEIIVVDNASQDGTQQMLATEFPSVTILALGWNAGPSGGFHEGMKVALDHGHDWVWVFNDDTETEPQTLEQCLEMAGRIPDEPVGIIWPVNETQGVCDWGRRWNGSPVKLQVKDPSKPYAADLVTFNGALVSREAASVVGLPRSDYFFGFWEWEYCLRLKREGFGIWVNPVLGVHHLHAGSLKHASDPWRGYYQTRNHLAMALNHRSSREVFRWGFRQVKFAVGTLLYLDSKRERLRLRALGAWHGATGRMGRVVDPAKYAAHQKVETNGSR